MTMSDKPELAIRAITRPQLDIALGWAADEGWNPGTKDADPFYAADPNGFLMAFREGEPIGSISVVRYDDQFGFLGLYIVKLEERGRGYGMRLWQAGMHYLEGCVVGLDGVVAQQANYARSGFSLAHRNVRYGGIVRIERSLDAQVVPVDTRSVGAVIAFDRGYFPAPRAAFLRSWLRHDRRSAFAFIDDGRLRGYGVVRQCRTGFKIGPLFAETEAVADRLFHALAAEAAGAPIYLDLPEPNRAASSLAARFGLSPVFETARMYRGPAPKLPLARIYGITTFELG